MNQSVDLTEFSKYIESDTSGLAIQYLLKEVKQLKALTEKQTKQIDLLTKIIFSKESLENINNNKKNEEIHIHEKELVVETCSTLNITYPVIKRKRKSAVLEVIHTPILGTYYFISSFNSSGVNIPIFKDDTLSDSINNTSKEDKIAIVDDFIEKKLVSRPNKQKDKSKSKKKDTRKNWSHEDIEIPNTASQMKTGPNCKILLKNKPNDKKPSPKNPPPWSKFG